MILSKAILVISGPSRMMYQCLQLESEGTILEKRSKPQAANRTPHDTTVNMVERLEMNIQGGQIAWQLFDAHQNETVVALTYCVVVFSILGQGLTIGRVIRRAVGSATTP